MFQNFTVPSVLIIFKRLVFKYKRILSLGVCIFPMQALAISSRHVPKTGSDSRLSLLWVYHTPSDIFATPIVDSKRHLLYISLLAGAGSTLLALNIDTGKIVSSLKQSSVFDGDKEAGVFYAIDKFTHQISWEYGVDAKAYGVPVVGKNGLVYFSSHDLHLRAFETRTGSPKWKFAFSSYFSSGHNVYALRFR